MTSPAVMAYGMRKATIVNGTKAAKHACAGQLQDQIFTPWYCRQK